MNKHGLMDERGKWLLEEGLKYEARQRAMEEAKPLVRGCILIAGIGLVLICVVPLLMR